MPRRPKGNRTKPTTSFVCVAGGLLACATIASAPARADVIAPAGLVPGDTFQLVFVTSTGIDATSTDIATYDNFVTGLADTAGLGTYNGASVTWQVIGSTDSVSALSREPTSDTAPIYGLDGHEVASNAAGLWSGSLTHQIYFNQDGNSKIADVWTGTTSTGATSAGAALGDSNAQYGFDKVTSASWVEDSVVQTGVGTEYSLYAISSILTVPTAQIPEPATAAVLGLGLAGLLAARRRPRAVRNP